MGTNRSRVVLRACAGLLTLVVVGASIPARAAAPIRIAIDPWPGSAILLLAQKKGVFFQHDIPVKIVAYSDYGDALEAYRRGEVDSLQVAIPDAIKLAAEGYSFVAPFAPVDNRGFDRIIVSNSVPSLAMLAGKSVAFRRGAVGHYLVAKALARASLRTSDITIVELGFEDAVAALTRGEVQAAASNSLQPVDPQIGRTLYSSVDAPCPNVMIFERRVATERAPLIVKFLVAWDDAVKEAQRHPDELLAIMRDELGFHNEEALSALAATAPVLDLAGGAARYYGPRYEIIELARQSSKFYVEERVVDATGVERLQALDTQWENIFPRAMLTEVGALKDPVPSRPAPAAIDPPSPSPGPWRSYIPAAVLVAGLLALSISLVAVLRRRRAVAPLEARVPPPHPDPGTAVTASLGLMNETRSGGNGGSDGPITGRPDPLASGASGRTCPRCNQRYDHSAAYCPVDGTPLADAARDLPIGTVLDQRFRILGLIRREALGSAYRASQQRMDRDVVLKVLDARIPPNSEAASNWVVDVQKASQLVHPNMVVVHDMGETNEGLVYVVMEYVGDSVPLAQIIAKRVLDVDVAVRFARETLSALEAAHARGLIHGHISPETILVCRGEDGTEHVKIADFGLAKVRLPSHTSGAHGAPTYVSPEVILNRESDARSDLYLVGVLLFEMICRTPPFVGEPMSVAAAHAEQVAPLLTSRAPSGIPRTLDRVVARLLEKKPENRFQSAADAAAALVHALRGDMNLSEAPFPIAGAYHHTFSHETAHATYSSLIDCVDTVLHFLAMCVLSAASTVRSERDIETERMKFNLAKWSMGRFLEVIRDLAPLVALRTNTPFLKRIARLTRHESGKPTRLCAVIEELVQERNRAYHDSTPSEDWCRERIPLLREQVADLVSAAGSLGQVVLVTPVQSLSSGTYSGFLHQGPQETFPIRTISSPTPLEPNRTYLLSPQDELALRLDPWVRLAVCSHCERRVLFAADGWPERSGAQWVALVGRHGREMEAAGDSPASS